MSLQNTPFIWYSTHLCRELMIQRCCWLPGRLTRVVVKYLQNRKYLIQQAWTNTWSGTFTLIRRCIDYALLIPVCTSPSIYPSGRQRFDFPGLLTVWADRRKSKLQLIAIQQIFVRHDQARIMVTMYNRRPFACHLCDLSFFTHYMKLMFYWFSAKVDRLVLTRHKHWLIGYCMFKIFCSHLSY